MIARRSSALVLLASSLMLTGCSKRMFGVSGATSYDKVVIGAGQSNMALMDLSVFRKSAMGVSQVQNLAVSGSELYSWQKPTLGQTRTIHGNPLYYAGLLAAIKAAGPRFGALLWFQGETEGLNYPENGTSGYDSWGRRFTEMIADLRHDSGINFPVLVCRLNPVCPFPGYESYWQSVRDQQTFLHISGVIVIDIDDILRHRTDDDLPIIHPLETHYSNAEYAQIAERLAAVYGGN